jgi:hypothetical protein
VNKPPVETDPELAVQVTAVFDVPVTVAVNCCVLPEETVAVVGEMATLMPARGVTVTVADACAFESALLVAVTVTVVLFVTCGAVYSPSPLTDPALAVQVTAVLDVPFTVALKLWVSPDASEIVVGEMLTVTCCCCPFTTIEACLSPWPAFESDTFAVKLKVAFVCGVPHTVPVCGFRYKPAGSEPLLTQNV